MTLGWLSWAEMASSAVECWSWKPISDAIFEKYSLKISATSPLSTIVLSPSRSMVWLPFLNFLSEKKGDIVRQKVLSCLAQLFSKYFAIDFFAQWHHMISQAPIFFPILFAKCTEFILTHIAAIERFAQFGVHIWYWLSLDKLGLDGCMIIYDVTEERTCIPSHIISVIEDVHDMKGCTLYKKESRRH